MAKAEVVRTACGIPRMTNQVSLWIENWSGVKMADGRISRPTTASALAGSLAVGAVEVFPDEGQQRQGADAAEGQDDAPVEHVR